MDTNRLVLVVAVLVVAGVVAALVVLRPPAGDDRRPEITVPVRGPASSPADAAPDRTVAPVVDGRPLRALDAADRPAVPAQWAAGDGGIPSGTWWSSAVAGPGAVSLWPQPLALVVTEAGTAQVSAPTARATTDGGVEAPFVPAVVLEPGGPATTRVVDHGPLHVTLALDAAAARIELTLVQGSPAVELHADGPFDLRAPGLDLDPGERAGVTGLAFGTTEGPWALGAPGATVTVLDDALRIEPGPSGRVAFGPVPAGAAPPAAHADRLATLAAHPLTATDERVEVADDGTTTQTLVQRRSGGGAASALWALQPHHQRYADDAGASIGTVASALGPLPVVVAGSLRLTYPAVPILWSAVPLPGSSDTLAVDRAAPTEGLGSYYGGKTAYAAAARADALRAAGDDDGAAAALADASELLDDLVDPGRSPSIRWEDGWGSAVLTPAEFGAGTELNDHQLQYGYWVAAASHVVEADPTRGDRYRGAIDLLVADYAGAGTLDGASSSLADRRTWSPYEGHSWASGTAPFGAGNNLESISESSFAWWAAARWLVATGRAEEAEPFVGRFTIESALTGISWLPDGDRLPTSAATRPWSGVVWSGKVDPTTWFDPNDESALGIRLLPVGPAGLARYPSTRQVAAARARWTWCEDHGHGCGVRWANLLDSDAAVAGRPRRTGPDPEPSTTPLLAAWWRELWERTAPVEGWSCSVGAVPRLAADGSVVVLAANPGPPAVLACRDGAGVERWSAEVSGPVAAVVRTAG